MSRPFVFSSIPWIGGMAAELLIAKHGTNTDGEPVEPIPGPFRDPD
jgi:hypothetical protein